MAEYADDQVSQHPLCYSILSKDTEFNSCYLRQNFDRILITMEELSIAKGYFNLFKYIEKIPLSKDRKTYEKAKRQLEIIHRNGIIQEILEKAIFSIRNKG